jgi:hypothetical protein
MSEPAAVDTPQHAVQFYSNERSLLATVVEFLGDGLAAGQPAIVIATSPRLSAILERLGERQLDVDAARQRGDLVLLDAHETLATFMIGDAPDETAFDAGIGHLFGRTLRDRPAGTILRAYGEMVDVLWRDGQEDAAIKLELLWNRLSTQYGFALMCGYSMGHFYKRATRREEICNLHSAVIEPGSNVVPFQPKPIARTA